MTQIATLLSNLLAHYWIESEHPAVRRQIIADWIEDLVEFTPIQVEGACKEWRQTERRRPAIADIRRLAQAQHKQQAQRALPPPPGLAPLKLRKLSECVTYEDKAEYYAEVYAWRIIRIGASYDDHTCPIDPNGQWWDTHRVNRALDRIREHDQAEAKAHASAHHHPGIAEQEEKYRRGAAWRTGKLDEYDAVHWPDKLRQRQKAAAEAQVANAPPGSPISQALREMGISSMPLEPSERPMGENEKERVRQQSLEKARQQAAE